MLVLITYDVNTETAAGKNDLEKWQKSASTMAKEFRILFSNALWIPLCAVLSNIDHQSRKGQSAFLLSR